MVPPLTVELIVVDLHLQSFFDGGHRRFHVHDQTIGKPLGDRQPLTGRPIDYGLLIRRGRRKPRVPLIRREELVEYGN